MIQELTQILSDSAKQLLMPRYRVIGNYPGRPYTMPIGHIITLNKFGSGKWWHEYTDDEPIHLEEGSNEYNLVLEKLEWWEERKAEQMPKKVMSLAYDKKDVFEIEEWDMKILVGWVNKQERTCCSLLTFKPEYGYIPV